MTVLCSAKQTGKKQPKNIRSLGPAVPTRPSNGKCTSKLIWPVDWTATVRRGVMISSATHGLEISLEPRDIHRCQCSTSAKTNVQIWDPIYLYLLVCGQAVGEMGAPFMGRWDNTMSSSTPFSACFIMKDALLHSTLLAGLAKTLEGNPYRKRTTKKGNCCVGGSKQEWDNNVWCIAGLFDHHWLLQILPKSPQFGTTLRSSIYSVSGIEARFFLGTPDKKCGLAVQYPKTRCFFLCSAFLTRVFQENVQDCPLGWLMWGCVTNLGNPYPLVI